MLEDRYRQIREFYGPALRGVYNAMVNGAQLTPQAQAIIRNISDSRACYDGSYEGYSRLGDSISAARRHTHIMQPQLKDLLYFEIAIAQAFLNEMAEETPEYKQRHKTDRIKRWDFVVRSADVVA